ncbi:MAG TPA: hypothetical protein VK279_07490 [Solirubrobacteraceae bacterium]|nr:hypothetical protein [Solirubrobacteraceae bacterium]
MYLTLLRAPGAARLALAALVGRLPLGMQALALILLARDATGSYGAAGAVAASAALATAAFGIVQGRAVDRLGQTRVLLACTGVYAASLVALVAAAHAGAGVVALAALAALSGASLPPLSACMRALWPCLAGSAAPGPAPAGREARDRAALIEAAYSLESILQEGFYIAGPLIVGALVAAASPAAAVLTMAGLSLSGTVLFATSPLSRAVPGGRRTGSRTGALASAGLRTLVLATVPVGLAFGALEVALPAFAEDQGNRAAAGLLFATWGVGSVVGGLWYGTRRWRRSPGERLPLAAMGLALGFLPLLLAGSTGAMAALLPLAGLAIAPTFTTSYTLIAGLAPPGTETEAFQLATSAVIVGVSLGNAAAGAIVDGAGVDATLLAAAGAGALAASVAAAGRGTLRPG